MILLQLTFALFITACMLSPFMKDEEPQRKRDKRGRFVKTEKPRRPIKVTHNGRLVGYMEV